MIPHGNRALSGREIFTARPAASIVALISSSVFHVELGDHEPQRTVKAGTLAELAVLGVRVTVAIVVDGWHRPHATASPARAAAPEADRIQTVEQVEIETPHGPARAHLEPMPDARGALILGHGAGGGVAARDLQTAGATAREQGFSVALVEQPYRVAGRRSAAPARQLDAAWLAVTARLAERELAGLPLIFGGRSSGARVACRTATEGGAIAVLCLAFPLLPPRRAAAAKPPESRLSELDAVSVPTLVVQGTGDRFGMPPAAANRVVIQVAGDHSLRTDLAAVGVAITSWLSELDLPVAAP